MRRSFISLVGVLFALVLIAAACGDSGTEELFGGDIEQPGDDDNSDSDGGGDAPTTGGNDDLMSVWPLPAGDAQVLFAWSQIDDSFQLAENSDFSMTNTNADAVLDFYRVYFPSIGIEISEFAAGTSTVMNLSDPNEPNWRGVLQTADNSDGTTTVHQAFSLIKDPVDDPSASTEAPAAVSSGDDE